MKTILAALAAAGLLIGSAEAQTLETTDLFVPWVSTLPIDAGQVVGLHVRHKSGPKPGPVVLFVHGATGPGVPDFDLDYKDYNWMAAFGRAGFDTYAIDLTGYGSSPRPGMDDPCNASAKQQGDILM
ncbi:MAG: hypothetical protein JOZ05_07125, partial [Acetobacteraceae bacterium]|nr:hypothetical protein [Acetobacteraceae bacterium]